jgi:hypothetical protein
VLNEAHLKRLLGEYIRKLPRQVDSLKLDSPAVISLGM